MNSSSKFLSTILRRSSPVSETELTISNQNYQASSSIESEEAEESSHSSEPADQRTADWASGDGHAAAAAASSLTSIGNNIHSNISNDISKINTKILHNLHDFSPTINNEHADQPRQQHNQQPDGRGPDSFNNYNNKSFNYNNSSLLEAHYGKSREISGNYFVNNDDVPVNKPTTSAALVDEISVADEPRPRQSGADALPRVSFTARKPSEGVSLGLYESIRLRSEKMNSATKKKLPTFLERFLFILIGCDVSKGVSRRRTPASIAERLRERLAKRTKLSMFLYTITVATGFCFLFTETWFSVVNGINKSTKNNLLKESANIILGLMWYSLGTYSIHVIYNILSCTDMRDAIRTRTKTYFRVPAWILLLVLIGLFIFAQLDNMILDEKSCTVIAVPELVCTLRYYSTVVYSTISIFWNYLVAVIIMLISRTHTHLIRRMLINLEVDTLNIAYINDLLSKKDELLSSQGNDCIIELNNQSFADKEIIREYRSMLSSELDETDSTVVDKANLIRKRFDTKLSNEMNVFAVDRRVVPRAESVDEKRLSLTQLNFGVGTEYVEEFLEHDLKKSENVIIDDPHLCPACLNRFYKFDSKKIRETPERLPGHSNCCHILTTNQILQYYSKILYLIRLTSALAQRWVTTFMICVLLFCVICLIDWTYTSYPGITSLLQFAMPLLIVGVIFGSFAESNAEGCKILFFVSPLQERLEMLEYLRANPLQIRVYGFVLDYSTQLKFIGAFAFGFLTQIIFHDLK